jgi:hypothetical protein
MISSMVDGSASGKGLPAEKGAVTFTPVEGRQAMEDRWYFAYGSNMQAATLRGRRGIEPLDVRIGRLAGYRLCFDIPIGGGSRGVANLAIDAGAEVWGVA